MGKEITLPRGIRLHTSGKFIVDITIDGIRQTKTFLTLDMAIAYRQALQSGTMHAPSLNQNWTLQQAYDKAHEVVWRGMASAVTNVWNGESILKYFGSERRVNTIKTADLDAFVAYLLNSQGNTGATVNRKMSCLSVMLKVAKERGGLSCELPKLPHIKETENRIRFLSASEETTLLSLMEECGYIAQAEAVQVLLYTGFRCGELWRLEKRDIDRENNIITVWKTKNGRPRSVPIVATIAPIIDRRITQQDTDKLFPEGSNAWLRNAWDKVRGLMGLDNDTQFVPHCLRHTCATRLSQQGVPLAVIKEWLGHTTIQTTIRYAHFNKRDLIEAAKLLSATKNS